MQANLMVVGNVYSFLYKGADGKYTNRVLLVTEKGYGRVLGLDFTVDDSRDCYRQFLLNRIDGNEVKEVDSVFVDVNSLPKSMTADAIADAYRKDGKLAVVYENGVYVVSPEVVKKDPRFASLIPPFQLIKVDGQAYRLSPNGEIAKYPSLAKVTNEEFVKAVVGK